VTEIHNSYMLDHILFVSRVNENVSIVVGEQLQLHTSHDELMTFSCLFLRSNFNFFGVIQLFEVIG
jgi:hypothetical protein